MSDEREPYSWDIVEIGAQVGHIQQLTSQRRHKRKHPIGFAAGAPVQEGKASRTPGTWPQVPHFDIPGDAS